MLFLGTVSLYKKIKYTVFEIYEIIAVLAKIVSFTLSEFELE
jgi:hypothetical protein